MRETRGAPAQGRGTLPAVLLLAALAALAWGAAGPACAAETVGSLIARLEAARGPAVLVTIPGVDPAWFAAHVDLSRDRFFAGLLADGGGRVLAEEFESRLSERGGILHGVPADSLGAVLSRRPLGTRIGLVECGLALDPPGSESAPLCLWISAELREIADLAGGPPDGGGILPAEFRERMRHVAGVSRSLRAEEAAEILALPRGSLEAFQALPDLPDNPMSGLKRVFLGDKLLANAALYAMSTCRWDRASIRLGLPAALRGTLDAMEEAGDAEPTARSTLEGLRASETLVADRVDRILASLWSEVPSPGSLWLITGTVDTSRICLRVKP